MADSSTGSKKKLTITACIVNKDGTIKLQNDKTFEVMINPASYNMSHTIHYNKDETMGQVSQDVRFSAYDGGSITINIVIDGTGVVNTSGRGGGPPDVKNEIDQLRNVIYKYDGNDHQPDHVRILWGDMLFFGRLESMSVDYTLFKPTGEALRAKVSMSFVGFMSGKEQSLRANKSSPDLTHSIEFRAGDTLPQLCYEIYKDCSWYIEVARANNIMNFRDIKPGTRIYFPPLG